PRAGELVCIFPEGQLSRTGSLMELRRGYELIARQAKCPIIPAVTDGLWRSIFSFERGRYFFKIPNALRIGVRVAFGRPLTQTDPMSLRARMGELGADAFAARPELKSSLDRELVRSLRRRAFDVVIADHGVGGKRLRGWELLGVCSAIAKKWRSELAGSQRVGVILPPGIGGAVANVSLLLAGKTPVNLNPTAGAAAFSHSLAAAEIDVVISASAVKSKFPDLGWPDQTVDVGEDLKRLTRAEVLLGALLPARRESQTPSEVLLFTSGSSGTPKGVCLTSRHLLANAMQIDELGLLRRDDIILSGLPLFHCFGLNVGLFTGLLTGRQIATVPTPFDFGKLAKAASVERATFLLSTPTFLKSYLRKVPAEAFEAMRCVCCGAERLPAKLAEAARDQFGVEVVEGYGLTETSPVVAFNQPDPAGGVGVDSTQIGLRAGTVGRLVPGLAWRIDDGVLALRGANVVTEYLGCPSAGSWFVTGDVVSVDSDGFLRIEGRTSRFSKIGGEMVPHCAVEEALTEELANDSEAADCVVGIDIGDGEEELALVTTRNVDPNELRRALRSRGMPNLWIPKRVVSVEALPALASGKVDLAACRALAATSNPTAAST
ncbi:MAG: AMP-binding protein, partial [Chthoniobacterales bacterium]